MGCKAFEKQKKPDSNEYRICQEGVLTLLPHITKRRLSVSLSDFRFILTHTNIRFEEFPSEEMRKKFQSIGQGAFVVCLEMNGATDSIVCFNFSCSFGVMCSREYLEGLKLLYL